MPISFDGSNKLINITSPTTITTAQNIYDTAMEWSDEADNMKYLVPLEAVGKEALGGGVFTDKIFILKNGWKIKPWSGTFQLRITGSLITDDETRRSVSPDSGYVDIVFEVATYGTVSEPVISESEQDSIAGKVWTNADGSQVKNYVEIIKKIQTNRWKIENNQFIIYDDDGTTELYKFNLLNKQGQATEDQPYERVPA